MGYILFYITLIFIGAPLIASAHGGEANIINDVIVFVNQSPISPLVGEKVTQAFTLKTKEGQTLANFPFSFYLIDTRYGDQSKDRIILKKDLQTDVNGNYTFEYAYPKENYFDTELGFLDPLTHAPETTGFLIQPRSAVSKKTAMLWAAGGVAVGGLAGLLIKKKGRREV